MAYDAFDTNFQVVLADTPELLDEAAALRYQVYCVERTWEDRSRNPDGRERDEFDRHSVHGLIRHCSGDLVGVVRLVLADPANMARPFPIEAQCGADFVQGVAERIRCMPRGRMAEISRFAVTRGFRRRHKEAQYVHGLSPHVIYTDSAAKDELRRVMPQVTVGLFAAIVRLSVRENITHWWAIMEPTLLRLLGRFGIRFSPIGPTIEHHGQRVPTFATAYDVIENIRAQRPDVWAVITDNGRFIPPRSIDP